MRGLKSMILAAALVGVASAAQAAAINVTDGNGNQYGNGQGLVIDFNTAAITAPSGGTGMCSPALTSGQAYTLGSVSVRSGVAAAGDVSFGSAVYLGVYDGMPASGANAPHFFGVSTNSISFTTATNGNWQAFNFSTTTPITVTADSTVWNADGSTTPSGHTSANPAGAGSGVLYFVFQTGTDALTGLPGPVVKLQRIDGGPGNEEMSLYHSVVIGNGGPVQSRTAEYQATLTAVPEPTSLALLGVSSLLVLRRRKA